MAITFSTPLSMYTVPVLFFTVLYPQFTLNALIVKLLKGFPNVNPRGNMDVCRQKGVPEKLVEKMERMKAAHNNGFEGFPLWAISILSANASGVDPRSTNTIAISLVAARSLYNYLYVSNDNGSVLKAYSCTAVWFGTLGLCFTLLVQSGNTFASRTS